MSAFPIPGIDDSTAYGPLLVVNTGGDLNDSALAQFLQQLVVGITGMPGQYVRPRWQPEPPNEPAYGTDWAGIGTTERNSDVFAFERLINIYGYGEGEYGESDPVYGGVGWCVVRQQILTVLLSMYGPNSESNATKFAMGLGLSQNREVLTRNGMGLVEVEASTPIIPELRNARYVYRVDTTFRIRRSQNYQYNVVSVTAANVIVYLDGPVTQRLAAVTEDIS